MCTRVSGKEAGKHNPRSFILEIYIDVFFLLMQHTDVAKMCHLRKGSVVHFHICYLKQKD